MSIASLARKYIFVLALSTSITAYAAHEHNHAGPVARARQPGYEVTITTIGAPKTHNYKRGGASRIVGIANSHDLLCTVPIELGNQTFAVNLDTGSSDLWIVSDACETNACEDAQVSRYPQSSLPVSVGADINMLYGDSNSGTYASGIVGLDTAMIDGTVVEHQPFGLINDTTNLLVKFDASGILGLGFPAASGIQKVFAMEKTDFIDDTHDFISSTSSLGPLLARMTMTGPQSPMFSVSLDRNTTDVGGKGLLTVGKLPEGVSNSSLTWVPVRLYSSENGGMSAPLSAPDEIYPYRWEVEIDGVFLDGERLPDSAIAAHGVDSHKVSALIDTGNSLIRGPEDVVNGILTAISPGYDPNEKHSNPLVPCSSPRTLAFQIGGQMFPVDPRDFISQLDPENAVICQADNLVATDPPSWGALFRWSLGTPFFRSNLVAFHYGNLTHPSVDPPRIGLRTNVPVDASQLLVDAVREAQGGQVSFSKDGQAAPTISLGRHSRVAVLMSIIVSPAPKSSTILGPHQVASDHLFHDDCATGYLPLIAQVALLLPFCTY